MKFKRPLNLVEGEKKQAKAILEQKPEVSCEGCHKKLLVEDLEKNYFVCSYCGNHFRISARNRIKRLVDSGTFVELDAELESRNLLEFMGYDAKLEAGKASSGEREAVITGVGEINQNKVAMFFMEHSFMMGSMGSVVGEKIARLFEYAVQKDLHVIGFCLSGGARMQEGIVSLMQMAKTAGAVGKHSDAGLLFVSVLTNPTTGGVTASFASIGDIIIAEPNALIGFAGPRVIEQTIRKTLPVGFQRSEFMQEHGFVDLICERAKHKQLFTDLLQMHKTESKSGSKSVLTLAVKAVANGR